MTVALDPDGRPFWGGTYLPKDAMLQLTAAITEAWRTQRDDLAANSTAIIESISTSAEVAAAKDLPGHDLVNASLQVLAKAFDAEWGGFGKAPKFPTTHHVELVMRAYMTSGNDDTKRVVTTTLDAMSAGGMYDHIGGGFARYSTDREWLVPHFEKMLSDQAAMVSLYRQGFTAFGRPHDRMIVTETIEYVLRELRHREGGFCSAQDADSRAPDGSSHEGRFLTWTPDEVRAALIGADPKVAEATIDWFGISDEGNFEGRSIPNRLAARGKLLRPPAIEAARQRLLQVRRNRPQPGLDDKVLTEWNALFLYALADAAAVLQVERWKQAAIENAEFLRRELRGPDGRWFRSWQADGEPRARHDAMAADYAAVVMAFIRMAELTGEAQWIAEARDTADTMLDWFWDPVEGGLYTTAEDGEQLVVRQKDLHDRATPSANSTAAHALMRLAALTGDQRYSNFADRILQLLAAVAKGAPAAVSNAMLAVDLRLRGFTEIVVVGDAPDLVRTAQVVWRPDAVLAWGEPYDSPLWEGRDDGHAYVCRNHVCQQPVTSADELFRRLTGREPPKRRGSTAVASDPDE